MNSFLWHNIDKLRHVLGDRALSVLIERRGEPNRPAVWQRTKTCVEMIKARIDQLDRNDEAAKHVRDCAM